MGLQRDVETLGSEAISSEQFGELLGQVPNEWVEEALELRTPPEKEGAKVRNRRLPLKLVLWLWVGLAFFRNRALSEVMEHLELVIPGSGKKLKSNALTAARERLGSGPVEALFRRSAVEFSNSLIDNARWRSLSVFAVDGTSLATPDTEENAAVFTRPTNKTRVAQYPQVRGVALLDVTNRVLRAFELGGFDEGERGLMENLWDAVPDNSVLLLDRGFVSYAAFHHLTSRGTNRHYLNRVTKTFNPRVIRSLGTNDNLVEVTLGNDARRKTGLKKMVMRSLSIARPNQPPIVFVTSLIDPIAYPYAEVVGLYLQRWEIELGFDEIKTDLQDGRRVLRSKRPEGIRQEVFGMLMAYNLVRYAMATAAAKAGLPANRLSFKQCLWRVFEFLKATWWTSPGAIPKRLEDLLENLAEQTLPRRRARSYPRELKSLHRKYRPKKARARTEGPGSAN